MSFCVLDEISVIFGGAPAAGRRLSTPLNRGTSQTSAIAVMRCRTDGFCLA